MHAYEIAGVGLGVMGTIPLVALILRGRMSDFTLAGKYRVLMAIMACVCCAFVGLTVATVGHLYDGNLTAVWFAVPSLSILAGCSVPLWICFRAINSKLQAQALPDMSEAEQARMKLSARLLTRLGIFALCVLAVSVFIKVALPQL